MAPPTLKYAIPVLHVTDSRRAEEFYCGTLGLTLESAYRQEDGGPRCLWVSRDSVHLHLSSFPGDGVSGGVVMMLIKDVDALCAELAPKRGRVRPGPY
jgi:hypothetical protein